MRQMFILHKDLQLVRHCLHKNESLHIKSKLIFIARIFHVSCWYKTVTRVAVCLCCQPKEDVSNIKHNSIIIQFDKYWLIIFFEKSNHM